MLVFGVNLCFYSMLDCLGLGTESTHFLIPDPFQIVRFVVHLFIFDLTVCLLHLSLELFESFVFRRWRFKVFLKISLNSEWYLWCVVLFSYRTFLPFKNLLELMIIILFAVLTADFGDLALMLLELVEIESFFFFIFERSRNTELGWILGVM